jgi:hypothetical protein
MTEEVRYGEPLLPRTMIEELSFEDVESQLASFDIEREHLLSMRKNEYASMAATYWLYSLVMGALCGGFFWFMMDSKGYSSVVSMVVGGLSAVAFALVFPMTRISHSRRLEYRQHGVRLNCIAVTQKLLRRRKTKLLRLHHHNADKPKQGMLSMASRDEARGGLSPSEQDEG